MQEPVIPYNVSVKNHTKGSCGPKTSKIAIMADFGSQHYVKILRSAFTSHPVKANIL